ncbi:MAG: hypothetical protein A3F68_09345 [Acidobacteria bacterium RIFCSPLOWO2_12_FULL_54_10]|nr:MAG: hypothetical protein A3F68_09345 [Acidobacteria bacterium RIFCSPLOWO2_12_FULL_54_10]
MQAVNLIHRKRSGGDLAREEIDFFLQEFSSGRLPDYQASALLMAIYFNGMNDQELSDWTESLTSLTPKVDLSDLGTPQVGGCSTGGVGDKTSLIVGSLVACAGIPVPLLSGTPLLHTSAAAEIVNAIPGFKAKLKAQEFKSALKKTGVVVLSETEEFVPADFKLAQLRNRTGTAECAPLIAASLLSGALACGVNELVVDVKTGSGSLMRKITDSRRLAQMLVTLGKRLGKKVVAVITDMNQPLGNAIGDALEVMEAVETMRGNGPADLVDVSLELAARMVIVARPETSLESAKEQMFRLLNDGSALKKFRQMIETQGGNPDVIENFQLLPNASAEHIISSPRAGYVSRVSADEIGQAVALLSSGSTSKNSHKDSAVGIVLEHKVGDHIQAGERLCTIYFNDAAPVEEASQMVEDAFHISSAQPESQPLIYEVIQ